MERKMKFAGENSAQTAVLRSQVRSREVLRIAQAEYERQHALTKKKLANSSLSKVQQAKILHSLEAHQR